MSGLHEFGRRLLHGPAVTALLERCGIDVRRFWLLVDLFETLGARQEVVGMGNDYSMRGLMNIWFVLSAGISVLAAAVGASPGFYLAGFLALTVFQLGVLLFPEIAESLVNPVDGLILAHQPVDGATWSGAKAAHLTKIVAYAVTGLNAVPALVGLALVHDDTGLRLVYPFLHFLVALVVGMVFALLCCSVFGWLVRIVPVRRLKAAAAMVQVLPMLAVLGFHSRDLIRETVSGWTAAIEVPAGWLAAVDAVPGGLATMLGAAGVVVTPVAVVFGLRAFSRDHLIRVSSLMSAGGARRRRRWRWANPGPWMAGCTGGQAGRGGFEYLRTVMARDWQFRRNMAQVLPGPIFGFIALLVAGRDPSPFGPDFAFAHFLPHAFGITAVFVCMFLAYGNDHKGIWCFAVTPAFAGRPFARGIHAALSLLLIVVPHAGWLLLLAWSWGVRDAVLFAAFSTAVAFLYLGLSLRLIEGVPFGKQTPPTRSSMLFGVMMLYAVGLAVGVGIQYLLFRSVAAVVVATLVAGLGAYFVTRLTLTGFAARMLASLRPDVPGSLFSAAQDDAA